MKTYFTNPGSLQELKDSLINDFKNAEERILVAIGFLNDNDIINAIRNNKRVREKRVILNEVDVKRAIENAEKYKKPLPNIKKWLDEKLYVVSLGRADSKSPNHMHHKFAIVDNKLWIGTYNFTKGAIERNWEYMVRFPNEEPYEDLLKEFEKQFYRMFRLGIFFNEYNSNFIIEDKCSNCNTVIVDSDKHFILRERQCLDYTVGFNYMSNTPEIRLLEESGTDYIIECINKNENNDSLSKICDGCGVECNQFDITERIEKIKFIDDGSVEFRDGYNELEHKDSEKTTYNCPKCFVQSTMRSRYLDLWEPGDVVPNYL
jgi:hypothetical protein